jgi:nicotinate dehydrogenase subunit A
MPSYRLTVNGVAQTAAVRDPDQPLLYYLRNNLNLRGPKFGCGLGQCGACTVIVDGRATRSCVMSMEAADGKSVTTLEGLGTPEKPHPVQAAFIAEQAAQCGYCINGMVMTAAAFLQTTPKPTREQVQEALADNLCRCGTHQRIIAAVQRAGGTL